MSKPTHVKPSFYAHCYLELKEIALKYGYNLVLHGSLNRDMDLIAIPWSPELKSHEAMIHEFASYLDGYTMILGHKEGKPVCFNQMYHGRIGYVINLNRGEKLKTYDDPQWYLDISVTPTVNK